MTTEVFWIYLGIMAGSTYLIRAVPFVCVKQKIENSFLRSFLYYIPYAVLTVMTIPGVLYVTRSVWSALVGLLVAIVFALRGKSLTQVAVAACIGVFIVELFL